MVTLYNTLTRNIEAFTPRDAKKVGLYACGFTVYDYTHLGHLRKYSLDDVLVRMLRHAGYEVTFVQNVTDVGHLASDADSGEDKLEKGAKKYGQTVFDVARTFEDYFFKSMDAMGNLRPDVSCRATEHIEAQLEMVKTLEARGFTYVIEDDGVYFDTAKIDDYGKLAHLDIEHLKEGARVEMVAGKRNPTDFALWKFERPGENRAMIWPSPWAERSFPGWHIECSAMAMQYLGDQFDVHTGGIDHIPVHHTNEIAQAEAASGKQPFVRYWVHHNMLRVEGEKMSKSLGNFFTIDDVIKNGIAPKALRLLFLTTHYRSQLNFTWDSLAGIQKAFERLVGQFALVNSADTTGVVLSPEAQLLETRFFTAVESDLNTPEALVVLWEVLRSRLSDAEKKLLLLAFDTVLGFDLPLLLKEQKVTVVEEYPEEIQKLILQRNEAREQKNWKVSDELRAALEAAGYVVEDTKDGTRVEIQ